MVKLTAVRVAVKVTELVPLLGAYINLEYPMPNGKGLKPLDDSSIYFGTQVLCEFNDGEYIRCFGIAAGLDFLLVAEYGKNCSNPELIAYGKR